MPISSDNMDINTDEITFAGLHYNYHGNMVIEDAETTGVHENNAHDEETNDINSPDEIEDNDNYKTYDKKETHIKTYVKINNINTVQEMNATQININPETRVEITDTPNQHLITITTTTSEKS